MKRILVVGDFHCGHIVGLTHPRHQIALPPGLTVDESTRHKTAKWMAI